MTNLCTATLECDNDCGSKIELTGHSTADVADATLHSVAELLGWTTRDWHAKKTLLFCARCQKWARVITGELESKPRRKT